MKSIQEGSDCIIIIFFFFFWGLKKLVGVRDSFLGSHMRK